MLLDLGEMFRLDTGAVELFVRTSLVYLGLLVAIRLVGRREMGALEMPDMLMIVLVADGVQNGMAGEYKSVTGAFIVGGTLLGWNYVLDWLAYRFVFVRRLLRPRRLQLVEDGRVRRENLRRALVSDDELQAHLSIQGVENLDEVKAAYLEPQGELSVIRYGKEQEQSPSRNKGVIR